MARPDDRWRLAGSDAHPATLTAKRAAALYAEATQRLSLKTGCLPAVASQRFDLWIAQSFFRWAVRRGHVGSTPFRDVKPIRKVNAGKPQLRIEEARCFIGAASWCNRICCALLPGNGRGIFRNRSHGLFGEVFSDGNK